MNKSRNIHITKHYSATKRKQEWIQTSTLETVMLSTRNQATIAHAIQCHSHTNSTKPKYFLGTESKPGATSGRERRKGRMTQRHMEVSAGDEMNLGTGAPSQRGSRG